MAKTIKFHLMLDGKPVRTIEELQENFCINDIMELYQRGILQKWLKVHGYDEYLKKVEAISEKKSAIIELIKIFEIEESEKEIKEAVYSLEFWEERRRKLEEWDKKDHTIKEIIADYLKGYENLKSKILENKEDMPFMKSAAKEIFDKYFEIFKIDFKNLFYYFNKSSPLIIYAILMNINLRDLFLKDRQVKADLEPFTLNKWAAAESLIYSKFEIYSKNSSQAQINNSIAQIQKRIKLRTFRGTTDSYWKDLQAANTKVMVLSIPQGTFVRSANKQLEELSAADVNGNFLILDGLCYKSNTALSQIVYMEV